MKSDKRHCTTSSCGISWRPTCWSKQITSTARQLSLRCEDLLVLPACEMTQLTNTGCSQVKPAETARHMYYVGRIRTVQLEYSDAYACLMQETHDLLSDLHSTSTMITSLLQAVRKAPQKRAPGFRSTVNKLLCIVQLLMGEVHHIPP